MGLRRIAIYFFVIILLILAAFVLGAELKLRPFQLTYEEPVGVYGFIHSILAHAVSAVIVAAVVFEVVERTSHIRMEAASERLLDTTVRSVAKNVAGEFYAVDVIEESMKSVFSTPLVRSDFNHETIFSIDQNNHSLLLVTTRIEYTIQNMSPVEASFEPRFTFDGEAVRLAADKPYPFPKITYIKIGGDIFSPSKLKSIQSKIDKTCPEVAINLGLFKIAGKSDLTVNVEHVQARPGSYNSVAYCLIPTKRVRVIIDNRVGKNLRIELAGLMREPFGEIERLSTTEDRWARRYDSVILPPGGWVLSWHLVPQEIIPVERANPDNIRQA